LHASVFIAKMGFETASNTLWIFVELAGKKTTCLSSFIGKVLIVDELSEEFV